jgi:hypothetical protein
MLTSGQPASEFVTLARRRLTDGVLLGSTDAADLCGMIPPEPTRL